jgi:hypothetical protein
MVLFYICVCDVLILGNPVLCGLPWEAQSHRSGKVVVVFFLEYDCLSCLYGQCEVLLGRPSPSWWAVGLLLPHSSHRVSMSAAVSCWCPSQFAIYSKLYYVCIVSSLCSGVVVRLGPDLLLVWQPCSAASLPMMPLCPGTHTNMMSDPICVAVCALFCISRVSGSSVNVSVRDIKQDFESVQMSVF